MIFDTLENAERYFAVHPGFRAAFEYLRKTDFSKLPTGRNEIDGERMFVMLNRDDAKGPEGRKLEYHRKYIDIQCVVGGADRQGWREISHCRESAMEYDPARDVGFYADKPETYVDVSVGEFTIYWPSDAHAPLSGHGPSIKPVMKLAVDWK